MEDMDMDDSLETTYDETAVEGWSKEEKYYLLQAIKSSASPGIETIHDYITTKSPEEITAAVGFYKQQALKHPIFQNKVKELSKFKSSTRMPLAGWAKLLTDSLSYNDLCTETSTAVQMIADLEDFPPPSHTEGIDFRKVYQQIVNVMEGKPIVNDKYIEAILNKCIIETALNSKVFIRHSDCKSLFQSSIMSARTNLTNKDMNTFPRPTGNPELTILRHLASQRRYNPFNIPEEFLKPSSETIYQGNVELKSYPKE